MFLVFFSWTWFSWKYIFHPSISSKFSEPSVRILRVSKNCFNLPASDNFGTFHTEKRFLVREWTFTNSLRRITCGNNVLKKVSFLFIFTLSVRAPWLITFETLMLPRLSRTILFEEELLRSSRTWLVFFLMSENNSMSISLISLIKYNVLWIFTKPLFIVLLH